MFLRRVQVFSLLIVATACFAQTPSDRLVGRWKLQVKRSDAGGVTGEILTIEKIGPGKYRHIADRKTRMGRYRVESIRICDGVDGPAEMLPPGLLDGLRRTNELRKDQT
jgi:hypothetical protein